MKNLIEQGKPLSLSASHAGEQLNGASACILLSDRLKHPKKSSTRFGGLTIARDVNFHIMRDDNLTIDELPAAEGAAVWRLTGPLVITSFFEFQERARADKSKTLTLDFSGVPYIDSTGVGALMSIYANRQKDGRRLVLVAVQPRVRAALQLTKVEQFFSFADTLPAR